MTEQYAFKMALTPKGVLVGGVILIAGSFLAGVGLSAVQNRFNKWNTKKT